MKASRYNYIFTEGDSSYWFNGLERTFFALPAGLGEKIAEYLEQPTQLEEVSPRFYNKLVEKGFLVDDSVDELNIIRERNEQAINCREYFLIILPTLNCNFKCWYCIQDHIVSKMSLATIDKVKKHIAYMIDHEKRLQLFILNGLEESRLCF